MLNVLRATAFDVRKIPVDNGNKYFETLNVIHSGHLFYVCAMLINKSQEAKSLQKSVENVRYIASVGFLMGKLEGMTA